MTESTFPSRLVAVVVFVLGLVAILFGLGMMPTGTEATERGVYVPWLLVWGMVGLVELCALLLVVLLLTARTGARA